MQQSPRKVIVWDPFVRVFHWSLVLAYAVAWASAEERAWLHEQSGYFILALLGLRLVWGLVGTRHARFADFVFSPAATREYLRALWSGRARRYLGHNPAGGWMVIALLSSLAVAAVSGVLIGGEDDLWEELHEGAANLTLLLVAVHVAGVVFSSLLHRENLVFAMLSGHKQKENADV